MGEGERSEMTAAAIARLAGVGRAAVSNWRRRYPEFPKAVGGSPTSPTFDRAEVEAWLKATGKADQLATAGRTETGTHRVSQAGTARAYDRAGLRDLYSTGQAQGRARERLSGLLDRMDRELSIADLQPSDLLARSMVALLPRETAASRSAEPDFSDLPVVLDPACGGGVLLTTAADRFGDRVKLVGQETSEGFARIARLNLGGNANGAAYEVHVGDSLRDNQLAAYLGKAAAVLCEPPFDSPQWPSAELTTDPRWEFGIPAPRDSELAWLQHCYAHLRPRGVAIVAVSRRTCVQPSGKHIRGALVRSGVLRAVISLPNNMSSVPGTVTCLWTLERPHGDPDDRPVRMVDLSGLGDAADVPCEFSAWQRLLEDADSVVSRAVPRLQLLDGDVNLLPSRYVLVHAEASAGDITQMVQRLESLYAMIGRGLPRFPASEHRVKTSYVTLGELERVGALTIRPRDATPREGDVLLRTQGRPPMVATGTRTDDTGVAQIVEIDETRLDSHFVVTFLKADVEALPVANTLGAVNRGDLRRCRIPRMPLPEQRRYGEAFRRLQELDTALKTLADVSGKVIEQTVHGLTAGALAPDHAVNEGETRTR